MITKFNLRFYHAVISFFVLTTAAIFPARAQKPCDMVSKLTINTGYSPITGMAVAVGTTDPLWRISYLSTDLLAISSVPVGSAPYAISPGGAWMAAGTNSRYLSAVNATGYTTVHTSTGYVMTIRRTFKTCIQDEIKLAVNFKGDDTITNIKIDGATVYSNSSFSSIQPSASSTPFSVNTMLAPGTHTLDVSLSNIIADYSDSSNYFGIDITGDITSVSGSSSIVSDIADPGCECERPCGILIGFNSCTDVIANPLDYTFTPNVSPSSTNFTIDYGDGSGSFPGTGNSAVSHSYPADNSYTVTVTILDKNGEPCDRYSFEICIGKGRGRRLPVNNAPAAVKDQVREPFPNPSNGTINIPVSGSEEEIRVSIENQDGKTLMSKSIRSVNGSILQFNTSVLAPGIYFLHITDGSGKHVKWFTQL